MDVIESSVRARLQQARERGHAVWRRARGVLLPVGIAALAWSGVAFGGSHPPFG